MHYTWWLNLWIAYCMSLWYGTGAKPDGNDGGESQRRQVFAHPNIYCHSLCKLLKYIIMFTKSLTRELKSTEISILILLQKGHNQRNVWGNSKCIFPLLAYMTQVNPGLYYFCSKSLIVITSCMEEKKSTLTFNQFHPHITFLQCRLPSSGGGLWQHALLGYFCPLWQHKNINVITWGEKNTMKGT